MLDVQHRVSGTLGPSVRQQQYEAHEGELTVKLRFKNKNDLLVIFLKH